MNTHLECGPCILRQAIDAADQTTAGDATRERVLRRTASEIAEADFEETPMAIASRAQEIVRQETGNQDPFGPVKRASNEEVLDHLPTFEQYIEDSDDPFETVIRLAIAGNIIDVGPGHDIDIVETVDSMLERPFGIDRLSSLQKACEDANHVMYLADNAGEIVLDRLLIKELDASVEVILKDRPFLNDATLEDAKFAGLEEIATLSTRGPKGVGQIEESFKNRLREADLIISKGQGNYELFSECDANIFFLFVIKCDIVARNVGAPEGSPVVTTSRSRS